jgi:hypothetical protein
MDRTGWRGGILAGTRLRALLLILGLALLSPGAARADDFTAGHLSFDPPARWSVEGKRDKLDLVSPKEDAFIVLRVLEPGDDNFLRAQVARLLPGYLADLTLADSGRAVTLGGMKAIRFRGGGSSDATGVSFEAAIVTPPGHPPVLVLAYTTVVNFRAARPLFEAFFASLRPH